MNKYAGKARIGVITILGAAALAMAGLHRSSGRAYSATPSPTLFVTDGCSDAVTAYPAASNGDVSPLAPAPTGLSEPQFVAIDASGNIYVTNCLQPAPSPFTPRGATATPLPSPSSAGATPA